MPLQQTRVDVFESIFLVFLGLGTLVGVVVVSYTLYNAYKYRDAGEVKDDESLPTLGELPTGGEGGKKLFLSFGISAIIVISLVIWTYGMLLYVESPEDDFEGDSVDVEVTGDGFAWYFEYENGVRSIGTMRVPADQRVDIRTTSGDVWHTFGVPDLRVKADAIPGEYDETWFVAEEAGESHRIQCFELCGDGHSNMVGEVRVMEQDEFEEWLNSQLNLEVTIENQHGERVTEGYELRLEHTDEEQDVDITASAEEFENGTITFDHEDLQQGGEFNVTVEFEDDEIDTYESTVEVTSPESETIEIEDPNAPAPEESGDGEETSDESTEDDGSANESDDGGDGQ